MYICWNVTKKCNDMELFFQYSKNESIQLAIMVSGMVIVQGDHKIMGLLFFKKIKKLM